MESPCGAHEDMDKAAILLGDALEENLNGLCKRTPEQLVEDRYEKFHQMGGFNVEADAP